MKLLHTFTGALAVSLIITLVGAFTFPAVEPELLGAQSDNDTVQVTLNVNSEISINSPADVTMTPDIGINQDTSTGGNTWTVTTNDVDGYTLSVQASTSPAMQSANDSFADYTESSADTPDSWSVDASSKEFGYSAFGDDVTGGTWGGGSSCDGSGDPANNSLNYLGFETSQNQIASRSGTTSTSGVDTTVCYGAEQNGVLASDGTYTANITATAAVQ